MMGSTPRRGRGDRAGRTANPTAKPLKKPFSPRLARLARALLDGPCTVRELTAIIPANNPPEYVSQLREDYGLAIPCERVPFITADGHKSWYGLYSLTGRDRKRLRAGR